MKSLCIDSSYGLSVGLSVDSPADLPGNLIDSKQSENFSISSNKPLQAPCNSADEGTQLSNKSNTSAKVFFEYQDDTRKHTESIITMIDKIANKSSINFVNDLDRIIVGLGPGPFTGLRVGITTAISLGLAWDIEVIGVSSAKVEAQNILLMNRIAILQNSLLDGILVLQNARRKQVYATFFAINYLTDQYKSNFTPLDLTQKWQIIDSLQNVLQKIDFNRTIFCGNATNALMCADLTKIELPTGELDVDKLTNQSNGKSTAGITTIHKHSLTPKPCLKNSIFASAFPSANVLYSMNQLAELGHVEPLSAIYVNEPDVY